MPTNKLSVQLYTVRELVAQDLPGTLYRLAEIGLSQVEPFNIMGLDGLGVGMAAAGLAAPTAHQNYIGGGRPEAVFAREVSATGLRADSNPASSLAPIFERAAALGIETLIEPHIPQERWQSAAGVASIVEDLSQAAEQAAQCGVKVGYHNHWFEFEATIDGRSAWEVFAEQVPDTVSLQLDTYWAAVGGADPLALLHRFGAKVVALHVKDGPVTRDNKDQVAVGSGRMPVRELIAAAPDALRVIELDDSRGDRLKAVADSVAYLTTECLS